MMVSMVPASLVDNLSPEHRPFGGTLFHLEMPGGKWLIYPPYNIAKLWTFQHDDAEPGDPRHGDARTLSDALLEIAELNADYHCEGCRRFHKWNEDEPRCRDCLIAEGEARQAAIEDAADHRLRIMKEG